MKRTVWIAIASVLVLGTLAVFTGAPQADDTAQDLAVAVGPIKVLTLPLEGPTAGKLYFEIIPAETGTPSAFKLDTSNQAAITLLLGARAAKARIRVTYKPDFTVTELECL
ncbi:MAG: hypothetical protein AAB152_01325 [Candidatus Coatesbacteria bacterium]|mgnify:CR=1 FL=1